MKIYGYQFKLQIAKIKGPTVNYLVPRIEFLSEEHSSCHKNKIPVTRTYFLSQENNSCHKNIIPNSCHKNIIPVKITKFLSQEQNSCHKNKFQVTKIVLEKSKLIFLDEYLNNVVFSLFDFDSKSYLS